MAKLTNEEKEILSAYEGGKLKSIRGKSAELKKHQTYAEATFRKDKRVNIRISSRDLNLLKRRALSEGIPYQTLIASVLHKYVDGQLNSS
jgi:predicted DNA binding CopG/RHH family protein